MMRLRMAFFTCSYSGANVSFDDGVMDPPENLSVLFILYNIEDQMA